MQKYILAIDEGTTGTTALLMNDRLEKVAEASEDFDQFYPEPGWVEHDLDLIWKAVTRTIQSVTEKIDRSQIAAIGITNQRETVCFWDKKTKAVLGRAIVWQDRRTASICDELKSKNLEKEFSTETGLLLDPYFSGTKIAWAIRNRPEVKAAYDRGSLAVGTIDSFLIWKLSAGDAHLTEPSNASRTLCFGLKSKRFEKKLCDALGFRSDIFPEVRPSFSRFSKTKGLGFLPDGIEISGVLGDQQSALLGQACIEKGQAKCTYGTGAFILMNTGSEPVLSRHRLLTTIAWADENSTTYALEGSAFIAGAAVQWVRDGLGLIQSSSEVEALAKTVKDSGGVVFVPALTGIGAPYWDPNARGAFLGITRGTEKGHMARAVLEGVAMQIADIFGAMSSDLGAPLSSVNVDGGASANDLLMQFQANVLGAGLVRPKYLETTSLGAVFAAGLGVGIWKNLKEVEKTWKKDRDFKSTFDSKARSQALERWHRAIDCIRRF